MIILHRLGHPNKDFYVNHELIVAVEANPDTVIRLMNDERIVVSESAEEVAAEIRACRAEILSLAMLIRSEERASAGRPSRAERPAIVRAVPDPVARPAADARVSR